MKFFRKKHVVISGPVKLCGSVATIIKQHQLYSCTICDESDTDILSTLDRAKIQHASFLIIIHINDDETLKTIATVEQLFARNRPSSQRVLQVYVLVQDCLAPSVALADLAIPNSSVACRIVSVPLQAARLLLNRRPVHCTVNIADGQQAHILVNGFGVLGQAITLQAIRLYHFGGKQLRITVTTPDALLQEQEFSAQYPLIKNVCEISFRDHNEFLKNQDIPITGAYICLTPDDKAIDTARKVRDLLSRTPNNPPVYLHLQNPSLSNDVTNWDGQTIPFSSLYDVCTPEVLFKESWDVLPRTIHNYYLDTIAGQGRDLSAAPAGQQWNALPESFKDASRNQADHVEIKLAAVNCRSVPERHVDFFSFTQFEVEKLATHEHNRWCAERSLAGWVYGPERDDNRKLHPALISYEELSEPMKNLDRYGIRLIPSLLAKQGLTVTRNLRIGIFDQLVSVNTGKKMANAIKHLLKQIQERFPDKSLVFISSFKSPIEKLIAKYGLEHSDTALQIIILGSMEDILNQLKQHNLRQDYLKLLAVAESRIQLSGEETYRTFLAKQADILITFDDEGSTESGDQNEKNHKPTMAVESILCMKKILVDPKNGTCRWNFEF